MINRLFFHLFGIGCYLLYLIPSFEKLTLLKIYIPPSLTTIIGSISAAYIFYLAANLLPEFSKKRSIASTLCRSTRVIADAFQKISLGEKSFRERMNHNELIKSSEISTLIEKVTDEINYRRLLALGKSSLLLKQHFESLSPMAINLGETYANQWFEVCDCMDRLIKTYTSLPARWSENMMTIHQNQPIDTQLKLFCKKNEKELRERSKDLLEAIISWHDLYFCRPSFIERASRILITSAARAPSKMNEHALETYKSLITISLEYFKSILLLNGGALVALIAYLGQAGNGAIIAANAKTIGLTFSLGCILSAISLILSYFTQFRLYNESIHPQLKSRHMLFLSITLLTSLLSLLCFAYGTLESIELISKPMDGLN